MKTWIAAIAAASVLATAGASIGQGTPKQDDFDACNREATSMSSPVTTPKSPTGSTPTGPTTGTAPSSSTPSSSMPSVAGKSTGSDRGIAGSRAGDQDYRRVYTDCMRKRGFSS